MLHSTNPTKYNLIYVKTHVDKTFVATPASKDEKNPPVSTYPVCISGVLKANSITVEHDPGKPSKNKKENIDPYEKVILTLVDDSELEMYRFTTAIGKNFTNGLAGGISNTKIGDEILLSLEVSQDSGAFFCNVFKKNDKGTWERISYEMPKEDKDAWSEKVFRDHPAFRVAVATKEK